MCSAHGQKLKKRGNPEVWSKTLPSGQCWQYQRHFSTILCKQIQEQRPKRAINKWGKSGENWGKTSRDSGSRGKTEIRENRGTGSHTYADSAICLEHCASTPIAGYDQSLHSFNSKTNGFHEKDECKKHF